MFQWHMVVAVAHGGGGGGGTWWWHMMVGILRTIALQPMTGHVGPLYARVNLKTHTYAIHMLIMRVGVLPRIFLFVPQCYLYVKHNCCA